MKPRTLTLKDIGKPAGLALVSVTKVERFGRKAIAYELTAGTPTATTRTLKKSLKPVKAGTDLFASPTLPETLRKAFKEAVLSAKQKYG